jgi:hypothetical protein
LLPTLLADRNGFVHSVTEAYNNHYHLIIRPDDMWITIVTQFSAYVNAHAEELGDSFVAHEGQKEVATGSLSTIPVSPTRSTI